MTTRPRAILSRVRRRETSADPVLWDAVSQTVCSRAIGSPAPMALVGRGRSPALLRGVAPRHDATHAGDCHEAARDVPAVDTSRASVDGLEDKGNAARGPARR